MTTNEIKAEFLNCASVIKRDGIKELLAWLENGDFYTAPASTRFHGSFEGGLALHSTKVFRQLVRLANYYERDVGAMFSNESLAIVALFHDLCKVGCYKVSSRNVKNDETGRWEKVPFYKFEEDFCFGGHGSKSVYLVQHFMELTPDEATAINCHMGFADRAPGDYSLGSAYEHCSLAWLLHVADEAAAYIDKV